MGAVSPVPFADQAFMQKVEEQIVKPTMQGIHAEGMRYTGFVFFGLINVQGNPFVIEYNCRMGDPETEVVMPRIASDLLPLLDARAASTVMLVAGGYPEDYAKGNTISGADQATGSIVFHAGTKLSNGNLVTNGGRVMAITSYGSTIYEALRKSYESAGHIHWQDIYYRKDLGKDLL
jgi:phosphoribosylamine--glycine ligase